MPSGHLSHMLLCLKCLSENFKTQSQTITILQTIILLELHTIINQTKKLGVKSFKFINTLKSAL